MNRIGLIYGAVVLAALPAFTVTAKAASDQDEIIRRLDRLEQAHARLEQENAALRTKLNRVDGGPAARSVPQAAGPQYADPRQPYIAVKAPVEYVRACSMYGAGFYTVPGTDACIKIGGYLRLQGGTGGDGEGTVNGADNMAAQGRNTRFDTSQVNYDARAVVSADVRVPTSIGLLRGYMRLGAEMNTPIGSSWMTTLPQPAQSNAPFLLLGQRLYPVRRIHGRQDALVLRPFRRVRRLSDLRQSANDRRYRSDRRDPRRLHF